MMEGQRHYPIETFDPLLRDLVGWGLVERPDSSPGTPWQLVATAQQRLDELVSPTQVAGAGADVYLDRRCADCRQRGLTRLHGESYVCDTCWAERQGRLNAVVTEPAPVEQPHFWRRTRQRQATDLAS
jgi:hypothetical protein